MKTQSCDVLIIGAGPAGALSAAILRDKGWNVRVLEKQKFPRFVIGESLLPRCMDHLREAGLLERVAAKGFQKKLGARFATDEQECNFNFSDQFTDGSTWTWQVPRDEFDMTLVEGIIDKGVEVSFGSTVTHIDFGGDQQTTTFTDADRKEHQLQSRFVIDGSGWGRVVPRMLDLDKPSDFPPRTAVFAHVKFDGQNPESEKIDIVTVTQKMWAWIIPFSDGRASIGFVGEPDCFEDLGESPGEKFRGALKQSCFISNKIGKPEFKREPSEIFAYSIAVKQFYGDGFVLTGNSTEFLDPIFSSGVTFAMESGVLAAKLVDRQLNGAEVDWDKEYVDYIQRGVDTFRSYVKGWYSGDLPEIFFASESLEQFKHQICSVLAGYVWDESNPFVKKHDRILGTLAKVVNILDKPETDS